MATRIQNSFFSVFATVAFIISFGCFIRLLTLKKGYFDFTADELCGYFEFLVAKQLASKDYISEQVSLTLDAEKSGDELVELNDDEYTEVEKLVLNYHDSTLRGKVKDIIALREKKSKLINSTIWYTLLALVLVTLANYLAS